LGNPILHERCAPVERGELEALRPAITDLRDTLLAFRARWGAGRAIAAPQIGVMKRLVFLERTRNDDLIVESPIPTPTPLINPAIVNPGAEMIELWDDCMSFPELFVRVRRHATCDLVYRDLDWREHTVHLTGDLAELLQHECDHLDGVLAVARAVDGRSFALREERVTVKDERKSKTGALTHANEDISERKRAEDALRESEGRLRAILQHAPVIIYLKDLEKRFTLVNRAFEVAFNRSEAEVIGKTSSDLVSTESASVHEAHDEQVIQTGEPHQFEETALQADGQEHTVISIKFPMYHTTGKMYGIGGISTDITRRKQADAALAWRAEADRAIAALAAALLDPAPINDIVYRVLEYARDLTTSTFGYVGYIDQKTGYLICPTMTREIWEICQVPDKDFVFDTFGGLWGWVLDHKKPLMTNNPQKDPRSSGTPKGHLPIHSFLSVPVLIGQELAGQIALANPARDYTERDLVLVERMASLYAIALQRIQVDKEIQQYAADLERSNQELEQFGFVISHDLQEPVRVVQGYLDLLKRRCSDELDDKATLYLDYAVDGAERMQQMIDALLDLSRVETRGKPFTRTDAGAVLERTLGLLARAIQDAGAKVTHTKLPTVMADEGQLAQVFQNLITNALKFRREDVPPRIHVAAEEQEDTWALSISDNGIGLDPAQADRIFEIFQRLHTAEEYPGLGIGLALCKRIVARHGGRIWVETTPGEGSTFTFTLPKHLNTPS
jgi:PAS domain S-box-containing protein